MDIAWIQPLIELLSGIQTLRDAAGWIPVPADSPLGRAVHRTADAFEEQFPDLRRQLMDAVVAPGFKSKLVGFVSRGAVEPSALVEDLVASGVHLETPDEVALAQEVLGHFLRAFNEEVFKDPQQGAFIVDMRSAHRDSVLGQGVARVEDHMRRIEAAVCANPSEDLAEVREAAKGLPLSAALRMFDWLESKLRRVGGWSRDVEAQVLLERGAAAWRNGDSRTAAGFFERAHELDAKDARIRLNGGLALAAKGQVEDGLARVHAVLQEDPANVRASIAKAQILQLAGRFSEALEVLRPLTEAPGGDPDSYRLHIGAAVASGLYDEAVAVADRGLGQNTSSICLAARAHAYASRADASYRAGRREPPFLQDLEVAQDAYRRAIQEARSANATPVLVEALIGRANVLLLSSKMEESLPSAREARALAPLDPSACVALATIALASQRFDEALAAAEPEAKRGNAAVRPIAVAAFCGANPTASFQQVEAFVASVGLDEALAPFTVMELLVEAALRESSLLAEALLSKWRCATPAHASYLSARIAVARGERPGAAEHLRAAIDALSRGRDITTSLRVAEVARECEYPELAVAAYDLIPVTEGSPDFLLGPYVNAVLALEDDVAEPRVMAMAARASAMGSVSTPLMHAEATVQEHRGELARALELWMALADQASAPNKYHLAVARCAYRLGRIEDAARALDRLSGHDGLKPTEILMVAELRRRLGQYEAALREAYEALCAAPDDRTVALSFLVFALGLPDQATTPYRCDKASAGSVVTLEFAPGDQFSVGVGVADLPFDVACYPVGAPEAKSVLGLEVGGEVQWAIGPAGPVVAKVVEVAHPFRFAVRQLLATARQRFPGASPISQVDVGNNFEGAKRIVAEQHADNADFLESARGKPVTLALVAKRLGKDLYRTWSSLEALPFKVLVSTNTRAEIDREEAALESAKGVVFDPLTLLDLKALGLLARSAERFGALLVPQVCVDLISECRDSVLADKARGDLLTVGMHLGELAPTVISKAQLEEAAMFLEEILHFCRDRCVAVGRPRPMSRQETSLVGAITEPFLISMMVAGERVGEGVRMFSNEAIVRAIGREACGSEGFSVVNFVASELNRGSMTLDEYSDVMRFCLRRMRHVTLTVGYLTHLVVSSRPHAEYACAVDALLDPELQRDPALRVAVAHIRQVAIEAPVWEAVTGFLQTLLMGIGKRYGRTALGALRVILESPRWVVVPNVERAIRLIRLCEKARWDPDSLLP